MKIPNVTKAALNIAGVRLRRAERRWRAAEQALGRVGRQAQRQRERLAQAPDLVGARVRQTCAAIERSRKRVVRFDDHVLAPYRIERRVLRALSRETFGSRPIIAGPWTSEVGYEALYWLPFLGWAADRYGVGPDRLIALSRGGTQSWYGGLASRYVEIFDLVEPEEFARQGAARRERGDQKQMALSEFDLELVRRATTRLGLATGDVAVWHPGLMYQLFRAFWYGDRSLDFLLRHTDFRRMYWTLGQLVTHHASSGCNLRPGDLIGSGTVSGPSREERGCLLELSWRGKEPLALPSGETRAFLEDGDDVVMTGWCERPGAVRIGLGECRGRLLPATD